MASGRFRFRRQGRCSCACIAASLNARDLIVPLRGYGRATGELPLIPVSDGVGTVVGVGEGVTRVKVGDRVCPTYFQGWFSGEPSAERFATALGGPLDGVMADFMCLSRRAWFAFRIISRMRRRPRFPARR